MAEVLNMKEKHGIKEVAKELLWILSRIDSLTSII